MSERDGMEEHAADRRLREEIGAVDPPGAEPAERRAWEIVRAAHAELWAPEAEEPGASRSARGHGRVSARARRIWRRSRHPGRLAAACAALLLGVLAISPAGAEVRDWVGDRLVAESPAPVTSLTALPGRGDLLVESARGTWLVEADGSKRLLGGFHDAAWSPHGMFVVATAGNQLVALEPGGEARWAVTRPGPVSLPSWNGPDGFRIAYLEGRDLRVVAGDGTGDRVVAEGVVPVRPAWRPGPEHILAYALPGGRVRAVRADTGKAVFSAWPGDGAPPGAAGTSPSAPGVIGLEWSQDGGRLLAWAPGRAILLDARGREVWRFAAREGMRIAAAALAPGSSGAVAIVSEGGRSTVTLTGPGRGARELFAVRGALGGPLWSPDASRLLVGWPTADQWLFLPTGFGRSARSRVGGRVRAFADISAQFAPGATSPAAFPRLAGWCC